jgi:hypothetical protein
MLPALRLTRPRRADPRLFRLRRWQLIEETATPMFLGLS